MDNANTKEYLDKIRSQVIENLKRTAFAPSVQMTDVPREPLVEGMDDEADAILDDLDEDENKDKRFTKRRFDQYIEKTGELSDSEDEEEAAANGIRRQPGATKRRNRVNYRNLDVADSGVESGIVTPRDVSSVPEEDVDATTDAKMADATEADTEDRRSRSPAEPASKVEEAFAGERNEMAVDEEEPAASAPISNQPSPPPHDEDTTMEDAGAPAEEPEQPEASVSGPQEKTPPQSPPEAAPATEPASPAKKASPAAEERQPAEGPESTTEAAKEEETPVKAEEQPQKEKEAASEKPEEPAKTEE